MSNIITSINNKNILQILDKDFLKINNLYLVEGLTQIKEAIKYNVLNEIYYEKRYEKDVEAFNEKFLITDNVSKKISNLKNSPGIFGVCKINNVPFFNESNTLILDKIQDPGNMGTLIRSAAAFGFKNIILSKDCVSVYNEKVLRSTQLTHAGLHINESSEQNLLKEIKILKNNNFKIIGTFICDENIYSSNDKINYKVALILGNEGKGIDSIYKEIIDFNYLIKTNSEIDSLNVAIAGSIIMNDLKLL